MLRELRRLVSSETSEENRGREGEGRNFKRETSPREKENEPAVSTERVMDRAENFEYFRRCVKFLWQVYPIYIYGYHVERYSRGNLYDPRSPSFPINPWMNTEACKFRRWRIFYISPNVHQIILIFYNIRDYDVILVNVMLSPRIEKGSKIISRLWITFSTARRKESKTFERKVRKLFRCG